MVQTIFVAIFFFSIVPSIQSCAPFFSTDAWKALKEQSSNMANVTSDCKSQYVDLAQSTVFAGQQFCTDIFAVKLFLAEKCKEDCQDPSGSSLSTVNCITHKFTGNGSNPIDNVFQFQCIYTKDGVASAPCISKEYNFQQVIDEFSSKCRIDNNASSPSSTTTTTTTSDATTTTTTSPTSTNTAITPCVTTMGNGPCVEDL